MLENDPKKERNSSLGLGKAIDNTTHTSLQDIANFFREKGEHVSGIYPAGKREIIFLGNDHEPHSINKIAQRISQLKNIFKPEIIGIEGYSTWPPVPNLDTAKRLARVFANDPSIINLNSNLPTESPAKLLEPSLRE